MNRLFLPALFLALALAALSVSKMTGGCGAYQRANVAVASTTISVEIADTPCKQVLGLSGRATLAKDTGMLFVFPSETSHGIWMKDMRFPIDIAWLDSHGKILGVEQNVAPDTYPKTFGDKYLSRYVLELPAGFIDNHQIWKNHQAETR
jgi:uncharacterized membrane protein (UPF0127 family)